MLLFAAAGCFLIAAILDVCTLVIVGVRGVRVRPARLTFAMARHAVVDLSLVFRQAPLPPDPDRLPSSELARLRTLLSASGVSLQDDDGAERELAALRLQYVPYVNALARYLLVPLPAWVGAE